MSLLEVKDVPAEAAPISATATTPKKPTKGSMPPTEGSSHAHKQVKVTVGKHKSRRNEGSSRAHLKGKEPTEPGGSLHNHVEQQVADLQAENEKLLADYVALPQFPVVAYCFADTSSGWEFHGSVIC
ncbi:hypothetical protein BHM03_00040924 [Ensete ventricosum]|nr:hypothetical protein BHM03_00040924 [Ensete ventricosum]